MCCITSGHSILNIKTKQKRTKNIGRVKNGVKNSNSKRLTSATKKLKDFPKNGLHSRLMHINPRQFWNSAVKLSHKFQVLFKTRKSMICEHITYEM